MSEDRITVLPRQATSHVDEKVCVVCIKTGCRVVGVPLTDTFRLIDGRVAVLFARRLSGEEAMRLDAVARWRRERVGAFRHAPKHPSTLRNSWEDSQPQHGL